MVLNLIRGFHLNRTPLPVLSSREPLPELIVIPGHASCNGHIIRVSSQSSSPSSHDHAQL